jgi:hypothetical protein
MQPRSSAEILWDKRKHHGTIDNFMKSESDAQDFFSERASLRGDSNDGHVTHGDYDFDAPQGQCFAAQSRREPNNSRRDPAFRMAGLATYHFASLQENEGCPQHLVQ